jgi:hypothetical protein
MARVDMCATVALDDSHTPARGAQQIGRGEAGDPTANHRYIDIEVAIDRAEPRQRGGIDPVRQRSGMHTRVLSHD